MPPLPPTLAEIAEERSAAARAAEAREIEVRAVEQRSAIEAAYSDAEMQVSSAHRVEHSAYWRVWCTDGLLEVALERTGTVTTAVATAALGHF